MASGGNNAQKIIVFAVIVVLGCMLSIFIVKFVNVGASTPTTSAWKELEFEEAIRKCINDPIASQIAGRSEKCTCFFREVRGMYSYGEWVAGDVDKPKLDSIRHGCGFAAVEEKL